MPIQDVMIFYSCDYDSILRIYVIARIGIKNTNASICTVFFAITYYGAELRINITVWIFVAGAAITFFITLIAVGIQSVRATTENPVKAIKME